MIKVRCECGKSIQARSEYAGRRVKCPACRQVIQIPASSEVTHHADDPNVETKPRRTSKAGEPQSGPTRAASPARRRRRSPTPKQRQRNRSQRNGSGGRNGAAAADGRVEFDDAAFEPVVESLGDDAHSGGSCDVASYDGTLYDEPYYDDGDAVAPSTLQDYVPAKLPARRKKKAGGGRRSVRHSVSDADKQDQADEDNISPRMLYSMFAAAGLVVVLLAAVFVNSLVNASRQHAARMVVPTEFSTYQHEQGRLSTEYPYGWTVESGGGTGGVPNWISFGDQLQDVQITIRGSVSGTAISDIAQSGGAPFGAAADVPDEVDPVAAAHQFQKDKISSEYDDYFETPPETITSRFGEGRVSSFTGRALFSSVCGLRATLIANQYQYTVICRCPESRLDEYSPVFKRIIASIGP